MVAHVLVPYDGTDPADRAVERAFERFDDPEVTLLRVVDPLSSPGLARSDAPLDPEVDGSADAKQPDPPVAEDRTSDVTRVVEPGEPTETIVSYAEANDPDAIVMGSRGRSSLARLVFGTVSGTVADTASAPVHVVY